jgi:hypothetical protein
VKEADYKRRLVADISRRPGGYARRVEDKFAVGVLDMIFKLPGYPIVFAEAKLLVGGFKFAPSGRQYIEGQRLIAARLLPILIGWKDGQMYLSPWAEEADIRNCPPWRGQSEIEQLEEFIYELGRESSRQTDYEWPLCGHGGPKSVLQVPDEARRELGAPAD